MRSVTARHGSSRRHWKRTGMLVLTVLPYLDFVRFLVHAECVAVGFPILTPSPANETTSQCSGPLMQVPAATPGICRAGPRFSYSLHSPQSLQRRMGGSSGEQSCALLPQSLWQTKVFETAQRDDVGRHLDKKVCGHVGVLTTICRYEIRWTASHGQVKFE